MRKELAYLFQLTKRLGIILLAFALVRYCFYYFNQEAFPAQSPISILGLFAHALRFDLAAIIYVNALFILSTLLPLPIRNRSWYKNVQLVIFLVCNGIALAFEIIDIGFFGFAFRRTIASDFNLFSNTASMIPGFMLEFWFLLVFFIVLMLLIRYFYLKIRLHTVPEFRLIPQTLLFVFGLGFAFIGARGGFQLRPIMSISAAKYVDDMRLLPLMTNTSLNLIFSFQQRLLEEKQYFDPDQLHRVFSIETFPEPAVPFQNKNVMIIVLESFGKEYIHTYNKKVNCTPFLDSLISRSLSCTYSFANGLRSTQGIAAITGSIPALMGDPIMFSAYQSNRVDGLAKLLKDEGYFTAFFHGANPGSMELEKFSRLCGFEHFFDRDDYGEHDFDGQWGVWDEPYFQHTANRLNEVSGPFCTLLFSLTSHHPYRTPAWFEQQHPHEEPVFRSVRYTDYALKRFFETAEKMPWYKNTLFVITADHIGKSFNNVYQTYRGIYEIPILLFDPSSNTTPKQVDIAQQIDIMPTVLDYLNYSKPYAAFGTSMLDSTSKHYAYMLTYDIFQIFDKEYLLMFENDKTLGLYNHRSDPFLNNNLTDSLAIKKFELENQLKAVIQAHHKAMIGNTLYLKREK